MREFEAFYSEQCKGKSLEEAELEDLDHFVNWLKREPKASAKRYLLGLAYYFDHTSKEEMCDVAGDLRSQRIQRTPFLLKDFRGVNLEQVEKLAAGIYKKHQPYAQKRGYAIGA